ncbi:MAG TPA: hypothetical protein VJT31_10965 [Rugosimonospora sp.]|nr:hypothetical protein [Rugosimonospora sp.]
MADLPPDHPAAGRSGSLLLRVWWEGNGEQARIIARLLDRQAGGRTAPPEPQYATGVDGILDAVRTWLTGLADR